MRRDIEFKSKGETCRGWLYTPDKRKGPFPTVIMAGGWCYVKEIVMPNYADYFVREGFAALIFDYRNFGASEGKLRQHLDPWWQIEDYRNAISYAETLPEVDAERIAIWGISYSGGHVLITGAIDARVKCILSTIPVVDGYENMRRSHGERRFEDLLNAVMEDRRKRYKNENDRGFMAFSSPKPEEELSVWPYPEIKKVFLEWKKSAAPLHEHRCTIESAENLLAYTVFPYLPRITNTPAMMVVAEGDNITLWDLEIEAFRQIKSRQKRLFVIPKTSHMTLYRDMSRLEMAATQEASFLSEYLLKPYK